MKKASKKDKNFQVTKEDTILGIADVGLSLFSPVAPLQTINSIRKYYSQRKELAFEERLLLFFEQTKSLTEKDKEIFLKRLNEDANDLYERILRIIDRLDEKSKAEIIGKLFSGLVRSDIELNSFLKLCKIIDQLMIEELSFFKKVANHVEAYTRVILIQDVFSLNKNESNTLKILAGYGIIEEIFEVKTQTGKSQIGSTFRVTELGIILKSYL